MYVDKTDKRLLKACEKILDSEILTEELHSELYYALNMSSMKSMNDHDEQLEAALKRMGDI